MSYDVEEKDKEKAVEYFASTVQVIPEEAYWEVTKKKIGKSGRGKVIPSAEHVTATPQFDPFKYMKENYEVWSKEIGDESLEGIYTAKMFKDNKEVTDANGEPITCSISVRETPESKEIHKTKESKEDILARLAKDNQLQREIQGQLALGMSSMQIQQQYKNLARTLKEDGDPEGAKEVEKQIKELENKLLGEKTEERHRQELEKERQDRDRLEERHKHELEKLERKIDEAKYREESKEKELKEDYINALEEVKKETIEKEKNSTNIFAIMMQQMQMQAEQTKQQMQLQREEMKLKEAQLERQLETQRERDKIEREAQRESARRESEDKEKFYALMQQNSEKNYQTILALMKNDQNKPSPIEKLTENPIFITLLERFTQKDPSAIEKIFASPQILNMMEKVANGLTNRDTNQFEKMFNMMKPFVEKFLEKKEDPLGNEVKKIIPTIIETFSGILTGSQQLMTQTYTQILENAAATNPDSPFLRNLKGVVEALRVSSPTLIELAKVVKTPVEKEETHLASHPQRVIDQRPRQIPQQEIQPQTQQETQPETQPTKEEMIQLQKKLETTMAQIVQALETDTPESVYEKLKVIFPQDFFKIIQINKEIHDMVSKSDNDKLKKLIELIDGYK